MSVSVDRVITSAAAIAAPVLTLLVDQNVLTAMAATDAGSIIAAAVGAYHGGRFVERKASAPTVSPAVKPDPYVHGV